MLLSEQSVIRSYSLNDSLITYHKIASETYDKSTLITLSFGEKVTYGSVVESLSS